MSSRAVILPGSSRAAPKPRTPALRLAENFFQRWWLILLPVLLMTVIGFLMTQRVTPEYLAFSTINTSANPNVQEQDIRGLDTGFFESGAEATARVMSERFSTDLFATGVAERAGLTAAIEDELMGYEDLRRSLSIFAAGESLVTVEALWSDPETSLRLVDAMIAEYQGVIDSTISRDATAAVDYFEERRSEAVTVERAADAELRAFVATLPDIALDEEYPLADQLQLSRLDARLATAQAAVDDADRAIDEARLSVVQAQSEAGQSLEIIDPPNTTFEPESTAKDKLIIMGAFMFLGGLLALTILGLTTFLDRSVRSAADIQAAGGGVTVAAVPVIKALQPRTGLKNRLALRTPGRRKALAVAPPRGSAVFGS